MHFQTLMYAHNLTEEFIHTLTKTSIYTFQCQRHFLWLLDKWETIEVFPSQTPLYRLTFTFVISHLFECFHHRRHCVVYTLELHFLR